MTTGEIYNIVKLVPKPGMYDQVVEAFRVFSKHVQEHEPKTQFYYAIKPQGTNEFIIVEKYTDKDNLKAHAATQEFKKFSRRLGSFLSQPPEMKKSEFLVGFDSRSKL